MLYFTKADLFNLDLVPKTSSSDYTFVRVALEAVYKDNVEAFAARSISGRSLKNAKKVVTPERLFAVQTAFQRLDFLKFGS